jgi:hypothetical protein
VIDAATTTPCNEVSCIILVIDNHNVTTTRVSGYQLGFFFLCQGINVPHV